MDKEKLSSMDLVRSLPIFILLLSLTLILSTYAFAVPNSLTLQGKLTDLDGAAQSGVYNFSFAIYDNVTSGNRLWVLHDHNITTDANGVYDIILGDINLSFSEQYYLGITVSTDEESSPRVNLTSAPYSFRTNTSDSLKANGSYIVENLSITGNVTIGDGTTTLEISTQLFNLSSIGNLNLNGTVTAFAFVGDGSSLTGIATGSVWNSSTTSVYFNDTTARLGIGTSVPSEVLTVIGNVNISGYLNISGNIVTAGTVIDNGSLNKSIDLSLYNQSIDLSSYLTSTTNDSLWNSTGNDIFLRHITGNVGIGTATPAMKLEVVGNANISQNLTVNNSVLFVDGTAGRVGIGTVSPGGTLDVVGSSASIITRTFTTNPTEPQSAIQIGISGGTNNGVGPSFLFFAPDDGSNKEFLGRLTALWENNADGSEAGAVTLSVRANSGDTNAQTEVLRVTSDSSLIVSGSLNASSINATDFIKVGSNLVQTVESAFNVANNATNDTLRISGNASIALWNVSSADGAGLIKPRDATSLLRIGYVNGSLSNDTLSVIGSSAFYGSLNATFINATQIRQGLNQVQTINAIYDSDNFTTNYDGRGERFTYVNLSSYFGEDNNGTILRLSNMSNIGNVTNNNQLANGAGYLTSLGSTSNFQLANVSNDTLRISGNASIALWNFSTRLGASFVHPRDATLLIRIGYLNESLSNDTLSVIGSSAFYGSLNATFINATEIRQGNNQVQTINAIYDSDNFTTNYDGRGDRFARENITDFFGDGAINGSILRVGNLSNIMESTFNVKNNATNYTTNYPNIDLNTLDDFNLLNNGTNQTLVKGDNVSLALWNLSNLALYPRDSALLVRIGTFTENLTNDTFAITGSAVVYGSLNATFINASEIRVGTNKVQTVESAFNVANNATNLTVTYANLDLTTLDDFNVANNLSNYTTDSGFNASIALWNFSTRLGASFVHPRDGTWLIRIGYLNESLSNDTLSVIGSSAFYGSLNATFINASEIRVGTNKVQTVDSAFNVANNVTNWTVNYANIDLNTLDDFNAANNATNDTLRISGNASIALWNASGNNIFNREFGGNVGIGTAAPNKKLEVNITAASDGISTNGTIYTPVINTTDAQTNVTITSGSGSVIIRLG